MIAADIFLPCGQTLVAGAEERQMSGLIGECGGGLPSLRG